MDFQIEEEPSVSTNTHCTRNKKGGCLKRLDSTWRFFHSAHFFVYLTHLISTWGDRMWHFAVSLFLVELNNNSLLLPAVFGLAVSSSLILFGALVGNWVDRNTRMKVVQVALLIQNLSVILCAVVLMLLFVYNAEITILWNGWMKIVCYTLVIVIGVIADLASTAMSIAIQRDWIIVVAGDSDKLSKRNQTAFKDGRMASAAVSVEDELVNNNCTNQNDKETGCIKGILVSGIRTFRDGWIIYYKQPMFLAALGLSFLYMTVLGFDGITIGYAYAQGISSSVLSIMVALSAVTGLIGTMFFTILRKYCGLIHTGCFSSIAQITCLTLCVASVFAPGSPLVLIAPLYSSASDQLENYTTTIFPTDVLNTSVTSVQYDVPSQLPTNLTNFTETKEYLSIALYFAGAVSARVGLWSFDLTVTQLIQEMVYESKRGIVNGVQGSMNGIMDLLHFVMVIIIPAPEHFGILVILSVIFVSVGGLLFFCFARKTLGKDLFKCVCMKEKHSENGKDPKIVAESIL
ncbi:solute carrier family 40 member 1-like isoform X3 [Chiloscyllium plagiosum]|uniref:solute carrier family 40 member 1-like isoform X3 n=1 Tax=Chiloscyllium plagiosum TaxID=36176 RepID=UPI001CB80568|nr:solute carrier family 40 member 1-like isoform X3 [Chiloscyllium plagiosum]